MADIFQLPEHLLERIATKLEWKSYFRMQQTCRDMADFFRTSQNVRVCLPEESSLVITPNSQYYLIHEITTRVDFESFYGARIYEIGFESAGDVENFLSNSCNLLKKYRITTVKLDISLIYSSNEEYEDLQKTLKPVIVSLDSRRFNSFRALLNAKELKEASFSVNIEDMQGMDIIKKLLEKLDNLEVTTHAKKITEYFPLFHKVLQFLCSKTFPTLRCFKFIGLIKGEGDAMPPEEELTRLFRDFNPILNRRHLGSHEEIFGYVFECQLRGHDDRHCELTIANRHVKINFEPIRI